MKSKKIALFHPWIKSKGGGEKVVLELLKKSKHKFDVYTWVYDKKNTYNEFNKYKVNVIAPKFMKYFSKLFFLRGIFLPLSLFFKIPLKKYDKFLISTSGISEFILFRNYIKGNTYSYVHTPLVDDKFIKWRIENRYDNFIMKKLSLILIKIFFNTYKIFEKIAWNKIDVLIFNSKLTRNRAIKRNLIKNHKNYVVYPLIDLNSFKKNKNKIEKYFIYISRLVPSKRQDVLIKAWEKFSKNNEYDLIIIGNKDANKSYYNKIINLSKNIPSIKIKYNISNNKIKDIISKSTAGIFLGYQEDFGIVPLEIISAGKPLLGVDKTGYIELLKNNPLYFRINEKNSKNKMEKEVLKKLEFFVKHKRKLNKNVKLKAKNFINEIDYILNK